MTDATMIISHSEFIMHGVGNVHRKAEIQCPHGNGGLGSQCKGKNVTQMKMARKAPNVSWNAARWTCRITNQGPSGILSRLSKATQMQNAQGKLALNRNYMKSLFNFILCINKEWKHKRSSLGRCLHGIVNYAYLPSLYRVKMYILLPELFIFLILVL